MIYQPTRRELFKYTSAGIIASKLKGQSLPMPSPVGTGSLPPPGPISHSAAGSVGGVSVTSPAIDTTGATLLVAYSSWFLMTGFISIADSKINSWTSLTLNNSGNGFGRMFYVANPTVGSNHTVTITASAPCVFFAAFSGVTLTSPMDQEATSTSGTTSPITPTVNGCLLVTGVGDVATNIMSWAIDTGFTILDTVTPVNPDHFGGGLAYFIQTTAAMIGPTWSSTPQDSAQGPSSLTSFKPT